MLQIFWVDDISRYVCCNMLCVQVDSLSFKNALDTPPLDPGGPMIDCLEATFPISTAFFGHLSFPLHPDLLAQPSQARRSLPRFDQSCLLQW